VRTLRLCGPSVDNIRGIGTSSTLGREEDNQGPKPPDRAGSPPSLGGLGLLKGLASGERGERGYDPSKDWSKVKLVTQKGRKRRQEGPYVIKRRKKKAKASSPS